MRVGRTSLYICAQLNSSGGGNMSTVHKRSTCSTYWRMVPLQRGLNTEKKKKKLTSHDTWLHPRAAILVDKQWKKRTTRCLR